MSIIKELKKFRARTELKIELMKLIHGFEPTEEVDVVLTNLDVIKVLSELITNQTEY